MRGDLADASINFDGYPRSKSVNTYKKFRTETTSPLILRHRNQPTYYWAT